MNLVHLSAVAAVGAMRRGELTAEAYAAALLGRAHALQSLNAFVALRPEAVLESARHADLERRRGATLGLLHGLPLPVKDSVNTRALPTASGTAGLRNFQPAEDAPVLRDLFAQGAYLFGKTNVHELSLGFTTNNAAFGACHNPYDPSRNPGGSSGGSAVAVAAHVAPLAVAEDTLGSIRVPAAQCGVAGLRPTVGRYPQGGIMPISPRFDSVGGVARSVEDLALFDSALLPALPPLTPTAVKGMRFAVPASLWSDLDPQTEQVCRAALERLRDAGAILVPSDLPAGLESAFTIVNALNAYDVIANQSAFLIEHLAPVSFDDMRSQISPLVRARFDAVFTPGGPDAISAATYQEKLVQMAALREATTRYFQEQRTGALVFPTTLTPALTIGEDLETRHRGRMVPVRLAMARNAALASCGAMPGLSLPAGLTAEGLPVGLEFDMLGGQDRQLLSLGLSLEKALGVIAPPSAELQP